VAAGTYADGEVDDEEHNIDEGNGFECIDFHNNERNDRDQDRSSDPAHELS